MDENILNLDTIKEFQNKDSDLSKWKQKSSDSYLYQYIGGKNKMLYYVMYARPGNDQQSQLKIILVRKLLK